jgi:hypothetical protein
MWFSVGVIRCLLLYVKWLVVPTIVAPQPPTPPPLPPGFPGDEPEPQPTQLAPGWYRNSGPSIIYEDSNLRISWEKSYIYLHIRGRALSTGISKC